MTFLKILLLLLTALAIAWFLMRSPIKSYPESPQFRNGQFHNAAAQPEESPGKRLQILWHFLFNKPANTQPAKPIPVQMLTQSDLDAAPDRSLFKLGHSTVLLKLRGSYWLTDPVFSERAFALQWMGPKRFHAPAIALADLPPLRGVILSHDHYDHLDKHAIRALIDRSELFLAPLGVGDRLRGWGVPADKIRQFDWWQSIEVGGLTLTATPGQHFSGRSLSDSRRTLWTSWVIEDENLRIFFSGDSGYFDGFAEIGQRFGPFDLTLMETGAYDAQWPFVHMQPEQSVQAHIDLRGKVMLPIHNSTFDLAMHSWYDPLERVLTISQEKGVQLSTPVFGERIDIERPVPGSAWWRELSAP